MCKNVTRHNLIFMSLLLLCILLLGVLHIYDKYTTFAFSHESGFYDSDFDLKIYKPSNSEVFYTLDGSEPSENSTKYTGPIHITDATYNPNVYSKITEDSLFSYEKNYGWGDYYLCMPEVPKDNIDKCTVIRAICRFEDGTYSDEIISSFFVGFNEKPGYDGMMVVSLISNPDGLFGYENGINIRGKTFDENDFDNVEDWMRLNANFTERGPEWERETYFQLFDREKDYVFSKKCGMRVRGSTSRFNNVKSYNVYAREEYDGTKSFSYDFWGTEYYPDKFVLYGCGQDTRSMVRDRMVSELTDELSFSKVHFVPCILFIDGEYWGIRYICEKVDEEYFNHYYGIDSKDILEIKFKQDNPIELGDISSDSEKLKNLGTCLMGNQSDDMSVELFNKTFDRNSFIDYYATMTYIARCVDWPISNIAYWASNSNGSGYADGKWRMHLFDVYTESLSASVSNFDSIEHAKTWNSLFGYLMENEDFKKDYYDRLQYVESVCFSDERVDEYLNKYIEEMQEPIEKHFKRFYGERINMDDFYKEIESIRTFCHSRRNYFDSVQE